MFHLERAGGQCFTNISCFKGDGDAYGFKFGVLELLKEVGSFMVQ